MLNIRERAVSHDSCLMSRFIHGQLAYSNTLGQLIITPNFSEVGVSENLGKTLQIHWLKTSLDVNAHFPIFSPWKWPEIGFSEILRWTPPNPIGQKWLTSFSNGFPISFPWVSLFKVPCCFATKMPWQHVFDPQLHGQQAAALDQRWRKRWDSMDSSWSSENWVSTIWRFPEIGLPLDHPFF